MTYYVQTLPKMYEEWHEELESPERDEALRFAETLYQAGLFMVELYADDRLLWRNGRYTGAFDYLSPFEVEYRAAGGLPGIPRVGLYIPKPDESYTEKWRTLV